LVEYYNLLGEQSPRLHVVNMGPTTLGNPFLALYISSPENLARLEELRQMNATLSDPRGVPEAEIQRAVDQGKAVVVQTMGLHSSEVAASQMAAELTHDMLTRTDEEMMRILDNTLAIMIPCINPDGEIMITDWYNRWVGTEYEGVGMPWLYHPGLHRSPPDGAVRCSHLRATLRGADPAGRRSSGMAGDELVRRPHCL
jgi:hypothetical protein